MIRIAEKVGHHFFTRDLWNFRHCEQKLMTLLYFWGHPESERIVCAKISISKFDLIWPGLGLTSIKIKLDDDIGSNDRDCRYLNAKWPRKRASYGMLVTRGVKTNFRLRGTDSDGGGGKGQIQVNQNHLPRNSDLSSDFGHFILEISEKLKILKNMH